MFITDIQKVVVERRLTMGYELLGITTAQLNGLSAFVMQKGRHMMCINSLGYCEHYNGRTYSNLQEA